MAETVTTDPNLELWLTFFGTVVVALLGLIGVLANRTRQHARAARVQVENSHTTNLREEGDDRHEELTTLVKQVIATQKTQGKDIGGIRSELRALRQDDIDQRDRLFELERTQPRKE